MSADVSRAINVGRFRNCSCDPPAVRWLSLLALLVPALLRPAKDGIALRSISNGFDTTPFCSSCLASSAITGTATAFGSVGINEPVTVTVRRRETLRAQTVDFVSRFVHGAEVFDRTNGWSLLRLRDGRSGWLSPADAGRFGASSICRPMEPASSTAPPITALIVSAVPNSGAAAAAASSADRSAVVNSEPIVSAIDVL